MFTDRFLFYDTECTTNIPTNANVISIGAQMTEYHALQKKFVPLGPGFHSYVFSEKESEPAAFAVHKITRDQLANAPRLPEAIQLLQEYIQPFLSQGVRLYLLAHNARFDNTVMFCNFFRHRLMFETFLKDLRVEGFIDTLSMFRKIFAGKDPSECPKDAVTGKIGFALGVCYQSLCGGEQLQGAHDALVDTLALIDICNTPIIAQSTTKATLFSFVVKREQGMKQIRQSAGMKFQITQQQALVQKEPNPVQGEDEPIWDAEKRFCLNCVAFHHHDRCSQPPVPMTE
jgi:DNA polymerase III epsilon subunit-like protein